MKKKIKDQGLTLTDIKLHVIEYLELSNVILKR